MTQLDVAKHVQAHMCVHAPTDNQSIKQSVSHSINQCKSLLATLTQHPPKCGFEMWDSVIELNSLS